MRKLLIIFLSLLAFSAFALPRGDYIHSCYGCYLQGNQLTCNCLNERQVPQNATITQATSCPYIRNVNGVLRCLPPGSYLQSCNSCYVRNNQLVCQCRSRTGFLTNAWLPNPFLCRNVRNINGSLQCIGRWHHWHPHLPWGSYKRTCTHCTFNGFELSCLCRTRYGGWQHTSLFQAQQCHGVINNNGNLQCNY